MKINKITAMYFSATDTTKKICEYIVDKLSKNLDVETKIINFANKNERDKNFKFDKDELVIFGLPTYAGRIPNVLLPFLTNNIFGNNALCVPIVLFGNRNYDDSLIELRNILEFNNFHSIATGAFVGEHSFSYTLAKGRPDRKDFKDVDNLCDLILKRIEKEKITDISPVNVKGENPIRTYYKPRDRKGNFIDIRKVLPKVNHKCDNCKLCVEVCPMGSIDKDNVAKYNNICIKCGACIKKCPMGARYYDDEGYSYHKSELEEMYQRRAENEIF